MTKDERKIFVTARLKDMIVEYLTALHNGKLGIPSRSDMECSGILQSWLIEIRRVSESIKGKGVKKGSTKERSDR